MALAYIYFYPADYHSDTQHLTTEEHGAYFLLLMAYWQKGSPLPDDNKKLASIIRSTLDKWMELRPTLEEYFRIVDNVWINARMERDLQRVKDLSESKRKGGIAASQKRHDKASGASSKCSANAPNTITTKRFKRLLKDCAVENGDKSSKRSDSGLGNQWFSSDNSKYAWLWTTAQAKIFVKGLKESGHLATSRKSMETLADEAAFAIFEGCYRETRPVEKAINAVLKSFTNGSWNTPKSFI